MNQLRNHFNNVVNPALVNSQVAFSLENVSKTFKALKALDAVSLNITKGEILFVTGASGAGKTTLLNILAGDQKPDHGKVYLSQQHSNLFVTRVFQDLRLLSNLSCYDNLCVSYDSTLYSSKKAFNDELMELCRVVGINHLLHEKVKNINGGAKQKVAIIRALLSKPDVLLADEPTCSMDKENAMKVFDVLNYYNTKRSLTVIWASHNRELVRNFPGKIVHLDQGRLVYSGHACFI
jgi:cell division transport system ATP-binding protein